MRVYSDCRIHPDVCELRDRYRIQDTIYGIPVDSLGELRYCKRVSRIKSTVCVGGRARKLEKEEE